MSAKPEEILHLMTVDEFFVWADDGTDTKYQLIDGVPVAMAPTVVIHSIIQGTAASIFRAQLKSTRRPCRLGTETAIQPGIANNRNVRIPDMAISCTPPGPPGERFLPQPQVVVEVLSPSNEKETRINVWAYFTIASLRDIVLLHTDRMEAEVLSRDADGNWPADPAIVGPGDILSVGSLDFSTPLRDFYEDTHLALVTQERTP